MTYKIFKKKIIFYSDIEFIIIKKNFIKDSNVKNIINPIIYNLEKKYNVKIDYGIFSKTKLFFSPNSIWKYELNCNGIDILNNAKYCGNEISISNLCYQSVKDLTFVRLWHVYNLLKKTNLENIDYYLCRNILDFLTIYLPFYNYLGSSYTDRNFYVNEQKLFTSNRSFLFNQCLNKKLNINYRIKYSNTKLLMHLIDLYSELIPLNRKITILNKFKYFLRIFLIKYKLLNLIKFNKIVSFNFQNNISSLLLLLIQFTFIKNNNIKFKEIVKIYSSIFKNKKILFKNQKQTINIIMKDLNNFFKIFINYKDE